MGTVKRNKELWRELVTTGIILKAQREDFLEGYYAKEDERTLNRFIDEEIKEEMVV